MSGNSLQKKKSNSISASHIFTQQLYPGSCSFFFSRSLPRKLERALLGLKQLSRLNEVFLRSMLAPVPFTGLEGPNSRSLDSSLSSVQMSVSPDWCHKLFHSPYALASNVCATSWNQSSFSCILFFNDLFSSALLVYCLFYLRSAAVLTVTPQGDEQSEPYPASSL